MPVVGHTASDDRDLASVSAIAMGGHVTNEGSGSRRPLAQRAREELARARELQLTGPRAVAAGVFVGLLAILIKATANQLAGGETGFIVLVAAAILAAWFGGLLAGLTATVTTFVLNSIMFVDPAGELFATDRVELARQWLFLGACAGSVVLLSSRRASRERVAQALAEVASLADAIESRDRRLEIMLGASGTGFWEWDVLTGEQVWSEAIFRQYGLEPAETAPDLATYLGLIHEDDRALLVSTLETALAGDLAFDLEFRVVWPDDSIHWSHGAGRVFRDDNGRPIRMIGTGQEITDRKALETERDRLIAEERRAGEFREAFIDVISHELRTPITTILGTTEILSRSDRVQDVNVRAALLADARAESERLYRLVEDLLVLGRVERGRLVVDAEPLEPRRLLERATAHLASGLPSIRVDLQLPASLPIVSGEATYVEQILRNLLENAAKYGPAGTNVIVSARHAGPEVVVSVLDDGPGVAAASLPYIFDLFYRDPGMARTVAGSGIGLFVCRNLAEAMGGGMLARQGPAGGSEFTFSLPVLASDEEDVLVGS